MGRGRIRRAEHSGSEPSLAPPPGVRKRVSGDAHGSPAQRSGKDHVALLNPRRHVPCLVLLIGAVRLAGGQQESIDEYRVKAAFLYNFAKFVEWPAHTGADDTFVICVLGRSPFGPL